jgi:hypothetical protein
MVGSNPFITNWDALGSTVAAGRTFDQAQGAASTDLSVAMRYADSLVAGVRGELTGLRGEMSGELAKVAAALEKAEAKRSSDFKELEEALKNAPSIQAIRKTVWIGFGGAVAFLGLMWAIFGAGVSLSGAYAGETVAIKQAQLEQRQRDERIEAALNRILGEKQVGQVNDGK